MPSSSGYGAYNPAAVDPYPIETDLAKLAVGNSPENAANLLDLYQLQRTTDAANYGHEMGIQHDFAKQQLAQQLKETYLKNAMDAVKTHGGLSVFNQLAPESAISPNITNPIETSLGDAQAASTAQKASEAAYHGLQAGFSTDLPRLTGMTSGLITGQTTPLQLQVQAARNAGKGGGGGGAADGKINWQLPEQPTGLVGSSPQLKGETTQQYIDRMKAKGVVFPAAERQADFTGGGPATSPLPTTNTPPASGATRSAPEKLPGVRPNPASTGGQAGGAGPDQRAINAQVENKLRLNPSPAAQAMYRDLKANAVNGNIQYKVGPGGKLIGVGKTREY